MGARKIEATQIPLEPDVIDGIRSRVRGGVLLPGQNGYDDARPIWNAMIDRRPRILSPLQRYG